jgi:RHS repeat-associated protein
MVDNDLQAGDYTIKLQTIDESSNGISQIFSINDTTQLVITSPHANERWFNNVNHLITWYRDDTIANTNVNLYLYDESGNTLINTIASNIENNGIFEWTVDEDMINENYVIRISTIDETASTQSEILSIIQSEKLIVTSPYGCNEWEAGETYTVSWYRSETIIGKNIKISLHNAPGSVEILNIINNIINSGSYTWTIDSSISTGDYVIKVKTQDDTEVDVSNVFTIIQPTSTSQTFSFLNSINQNSLKNHNVNEKTNCKDYNYIESICYYESVWDPMDTNELNINYNSDKFAIIPKYRHNNDDFPNRNIIGTRKINSNTKSRNKNQKLVSSYTITDTYFIWSYDGKLLAEYDTTGICIKDYIYAGNKLIAEYQPQTGNYYYYMQDQVNSTKIVTNDAGDIVHSTAYGPYGNTQITWINTFDPKPKFSGKERNSHTQWDYFGARYYDHLSYRFTSVDPIINKKDAITNPQLWNLYSYCRNNPITYLDPDGRDIWNSIGTWWKSTPVSHFIRGDFEGGLRQIEKNLDTQLSDPTFVLGFIGGIKFKGKSLVKLKEPSKFSKIFLGKKYRTKPNRAGKMQPFNKKGLYLNYEANPGIFKSSFSMFSRGFSEGIVSGFTPGNVFPPLAISKIRSWGQSIGKIVGVVLGRFIR